MSVDIYEYDGLGYNPLLLTPNWQAAILNWDPSCERENLREIERHNHTDEVFVLLRGRAVLFARRENEALQAYELKPGVIYNVPKRVWHGLVADKEASFLIVEDLNTHLHDTEVRPIMENELMELDAQLPKWIQK
jgi:mannose-6-phosphate isomerase-like protein (cupin superfamily)